MPAVCSVALIPWTIYLRHRLPNTYTTTHWAGTWTGFDILLRTCLAITAWLCWKERPSTVLAQTASATLLVADAWFDVTTSAPADHVTSLANLLVETPLATVLFIAALNTLRELTHELHPYTPDDPSP